MPSDIVIIGAGPAGLSLAGSLADTGMNITMLERQPLAAIESPAYDGREIALTHRSVALLKNLGAWANLSEQQISPIKHARVQDGVSPYTLNFDKPDKLEALGFLVSNHDLRRSIYRQVSQHSNVDLRCDTTVINVQSGAQHASVTLADQTVIDAPLVVAADTRFSASRRMMGIGADMQDFGRVVIVCKVKHDREHAATAVECFQYGSTLAVLPLSGLQSSIVLTAPSHIAKAEMGKSDEQYARDLAARLNHRLGQFELISERHTYPLVAVHARGFHARRFALIGDAAVGMHPVTAHGFNLGLSGQSILAKQIKASRARGVDISAATGLANYTRVHSRETRPLYIGTNKIVGLFTDDAMPAKLMRKLLLRVANNVAPIKWAIERHLTEAHHQRSSK